MTTTSAAQLAAALLDAQVAWHLAELGDDCVTALLEREVDDWYAVGSRLRLRDVLSRDALVGALQRIAVGVADASLLTDLAGEIPARVHELPQNADHLLGEVIAREDVEEVVAALLDLDRFQERTLDRLTASPLVGVVASAFVTRLVSDVLAQNTEMARKVPGMSSLLAFGGSAVGRVRGLADRQLEGLLGDAVGKGGEFAVRRVNAALLGVLRTGPVREAILEAWDLEADEPISALASDLPAEGLRRLTEGLQVLLVGAAGTAYVAEVVPACVDVLLERYGDDDVVTVLAAAGVARDELVQTLDEAARTLLGALRESGELERMVRSRLEPFYASAQVQRLLGGRPRRR